VCRCHPSQISSHRANLTSSPHRNNEAHTTDIRYTFTAPRASGRVPAVPARCGPADERRRRAGGEGQGEHDGREGCAHGEGAAEQTGRQVAQQRVVQPGAVPGERDVRPQNQSMSIPYVHSVVGDINADLCRRQHAHGQAGPAAWPNLVVLLPRFFKCTNTSKIMNGELEWGEFCRQCRQKGDFVAVCRAVISPGPEKKWRDFWGLGSPR
jgi:hypothetical protein